MDSNGDGRGLHPCRTNDVLLHATCQARQIKARQIGAAIDAGREEAIVTTKSHRSINAPQPATKIIARTLQYEDNTFMRV